METMLLEYHIYVLSETQRDSGDKKLTEQPPRPPAAARALETRKAACVCECVCGAGGVAVC
jgi:hypothetical protein